MIAEEIMACKDRIHRLLAKPDVFSEEDTQRAHIFLDILSVFQVEIACELKAWDRVLEVVKVISPPLLLASKSFQFLKYCSALVGRISCAKRSIGSVGVNYRYSGIPLRVLGPRPPR